MQTLPSGRIGKTCIAFSSLKAAAADIADVVSAHFDLGVGRNHHFPGFVDFLLVDKDNAGHDERQRAPALHQTILAQVLIQANLSCLFLL